MSSNNAVFHRLALIRCHFLLKTPHKGTNEIHKIWNRIATKWMPSLAMTEYYFYIVSFMWRKMVCSRLLHSVTAGRSNLIWPSLWVKWNEMRETEKIWEEKATETKCRQRQPTNIRHFWLVWPKMIIFIFLFDCLWNWRNMEYSPSKGTKRQKLDRERKREEKSRCRAFARLLNLFSAFSSRLCAWFVSFALWIQNIRKNYFGSLNILNGNCLLQLQDEYSFGFILAFDFNFHCIALVLSALCLASFIWFVTFFQAMKMLPTKKYNLRNCFYLSPNIARKSCSITVQWI